MRSLADPRIAKHLEEMASIKPKVSLSCEECIYRTNNLTWKMAKRRMLNHKCKHHHRDPNNNPVKALTKEFAEETEQRTNVGQGRGPIPLRRVTWRLSPARKLKKKIRVTKRKETK